MERKVGWGGKLLYGAIFLLLKKQCGLLFENSGSHFSDRKRNMVQFMLLGSLAIIKVFTKSMTFYNKICSSYEATCLRFRDMWQVQK